jgi:hypothetical protein
MKFTALGSHTPSKTKRHFRHPTPFAQPSDRRLQFDLFLLKPRRLPTRRGQPRRTRTETHYERRFNGG